MPNSTASANNSVEALNLYAKIEDLIGVNEVSYTLYKYYYDILNQINFNSLLDIGCGKGDFLYEVKKQFNPKLLQGIDRSSLMVKCAKEKGLNVSTKELNDFNKKVDIGTATFDMINYLTPQEFIDFFQDLKSVIKENGYFIFDVNTKFGLSELAVGNFIAEDKQRFLAIESFYENGLYESSFTLFEKKENFYIKSSECISQYYYSQEFFELLSGWEIQSIIPVKLYGMEEFDKTIYLLKKLIQTED